MLEFSSKLKCKVNYTKNFKTNYKKIKKQGKNIEKLKKVVEQLANKEKLDEKYLNHNLNNSKYYKDCGECHIEPDWLLLYKYQNDELILLLVATGSHSEIF